MSNSSTDVILYSILSLVTLIKLIIVYVSSKHDLIINSFVGSQVINITGSTIFSGIIIFILVFIVLMLQFFSDSKRHTILTLLILILSIISLYNAYILF